MSNTDNLAKAIEDTLDAYAMRETGTAYELLGQLLLAGQILDNIHKHGKYSYEQAMSAINMAYSIGRMEHISEQDEKRGK